MRKLIFLSLWLATAVMASMVLTIDDVQAQCALQKMHGSWLNVNPNTRSLTAASISFVCGDYRPIPVGKSGEALKKNPVAYIRVYGACHPTGCDWGEIPVYEGHWSQSEANYTYLYARYNPGFARKDIHVYLEANGRLKIVTQTHFTDGSGRADYTATDIFFKGENLNLVAKHSGKCLDVSEVSQKDKAVVHQWGCLGLSQANQLWSFRLAGGGYYEIAVKHSQKCLDVRKGSSKNGAVVQQYKCSWGEKPNQSWYLRPMSKGYYQVVAKHSGKCLDVDISKAANANGTKVQQWNCLSSQQANQLWKLQPAR